MIGVRRFAITGALFLTASCGPTDGSGPLEPGVSFDQQPGPDGLRPFHGWIEGRLSFVPPFEPGSLDDCNANFSGDPAHPGPSVSGFDEADAVFSVIGRVRLYSAFCFDPDSPVSEGTGVLAAMNGDEISIGFTNAAGVPGVDGTIPVHGPQWITGGTGRFTGASGDQVCSFLVNAVTLAISGHCQGVIRFDPTGG